MPPKKLKHLLDDYLKGTDFKDINTTISIQLVWEKMVGKQISSNTKIQSFKNGTIIINVSNSIWRNELSLQKQILLEKLKKKEPNLKIKDIILK